MSDLTTWQRSLIGVFIVLVAYAAGFNGGIGWEKTSQELVTPTPPAVHYNTINV